MFYGVLSPELVGSLSQSLFGPSFLKYFTLGQTYSHNVAGRNPVIGNTVSDVWGYPSTPGGASQFVRAIASAGFTLGVCSDSGSDTIALGSGAQEVAVSYLDTNFIPWVATYPLLGNSVETLAINITPGFVPGTAQGGTVTNCLRINDMIVIQAGSGNANVGNIYAFDSSSAVVAGVPSTSSKVYACIMVGDNGSQMAEYTVPGGYVGALTQGITGLQTVGTSNIYGKMILQIDNNGNGLFKSIPINNVSCGATPQVVHNNVVTTMPGQTNFRIQCQAGASGAEAVAVFSLVLWPTP